MNLLAIETSTSRASVALCVEGRRFALEETSLNQHAQVLIAMIEKLFALAQVDFQALDGIVFGEGPGSFTGVRIACSIAKGLAYAHGLPLFPVSGLHAIAFQVRHLNMPVLAILDARMNQVYWAFEPNKGGEAHVSSPENIIIPGLITSDSNQLSHAMILAGVAFNAYVGAFPQALKRCIESQHEVFPEASAMIALVHAGYIDAVSVENAAPTYVREQVTGGGHG